MILCFTAGIYRGNFSEEMTVDGQKSKQRIPNTPHLLEPLTFALGWIIPLQLELGRDGEEETEILE